MSFLAPLFLAGAAAAAIPIVLHLLKREPEPRVKFAAVKLLKRAPVEHTQRHRLRELLLLALRVAALLLLAFAFARPFFASGDAAVSSGVTVVALDNSYSLSAPGRFDRAKQLARDAVNRAASGDLVGVVIFSDQAAIAARPSADRVLATSAIDQATTAYGGTRYRAALSAASQAMAGRHGTIVVVTDLQEGGWDAGDRASIPDGVRVEIADVGALPPNLSVTSVRPLADRIAATVHNSGPRSRDARVHLAIDGRPAGDAGTPVGPGQSADVTFAGAPKGAAAAVTVDDPDGIQADNTRYALLADDTKPRVLVVTGTGSLDREGFYLGHALAAGRSASASYQVEPTSGAALSTVAEERLSSAAAVMLLSTRGLERRGRELLASYVQRGGGLFVAVGPDLDGDVVADVLGGAGRLRITAPSPGVKLPPRALAPADVRHPVFRPFSGNAAALGLVKFHTSARIEGDGCHIVARFTTGEPALLDCAAGDGHALVLASDVDNRWNDFPVHATFVPFVHEAVTYLSSGRAHGSDYVVGDAPAGAPRTPGIHAIADPARPGSTRRIAVNVDPREGEPGRMTAAEFQSAITRLRTAAAAQARVEARQQEDRQHLWEYAVALMVITLAAEGMVAGRTA